MAQKIFPRQEERGFWSQAEGTLKCGLSVIPVTPPAPG